MDVTNAPGSVAGEYVDEDIDGGIAGTANIARDRNIQQKEMCNPVLDAGFTLNAADFHQLERAIIRLSKKVGELITSPIELTPVPLAASRSVTNPAYPLYNPIIPIHDANHDISTTEVPQAIIDELNAHKFKFGASVDLAVTVSGTTITFGAGGDADKLLGAVNELALVNRWYDAEAAGYGALGGLFTGPRQYCFTVSSNGVNYAITGCSVGSRTLTAASAPPSGAQTISIHPFRIAGVTDESRIRRISGEALVAAGDLTGEVLVGGARNNRILSHRHSIYADNINRGAGAALGIVSLQGDVASQIIFLSASARDLASDGTNTLVTGKTNDPRTAGVGVYMHLANLLATTWTSA